MTGTMIDVGIGLAFTYLLFSLVVSSLNELLSRWSSRRAEVMWQGMEGLFRSSDFRDVFYAHPLVKSLFNGSRKPSYIPAGVFALTVINLAIELRPPTKDQPGLTTVLDDYRADVEREPRGDGTTHNCRLERLGFPKCPRPQKADVAIVDSLKHELAEPTKILLQTIVGNTGGSFAGAQLALEDWFNDGVKRISGVYKRRTYIYTWLLALLVTLTFNVETLRIANRLYYDSALRTATVSQAESFVQTKGGQGGKTSIDFPASIGQLRIPLGWSASDSNWTAKQYLLENPISHCLGFLLSAVALSLGAPFWFDTLNKFVNVRQVGDRPDPKGKPNIITARST